MTLANHLRETRRALVPRVIEYRTTDARVVGAVRLLDPAADEIERLAGAVEILRRHGDAMAKALNADAKRASGKDNAVDLHAANYEIDLLYLDRGEKPPEHLRRDDPPKKPEVVPICLHHSRHNLNETHG